MNDYVSVQTILMKLIISLIVRGSCYSGVNIISNQE